MTQSDKQVELIDLGLMDYKEAWNTQESYFDKIVEIKMRNRQNEESGGAQEFTGNYLLFCEHPHVYTLGKSGEENNLLANPELLQQRGATFYKINRGGDITYHGPGQIVMYPILNLEYFFTDIHKYLRFLEEAVIRTLAEYGIKGERYEGYTGVWLDVDHPAKARKICAMGVRCSRWVTMHGIGFNVNTDLSYFNLIVPCGITDKQVTSMEKELGHTVDMNEVRQKLISHLEEVFKMTVLEKTH